MTTAAIASPAAAPPWTWRFLLWLHKRPSPRQWLMLALGALAFQLAWSVLGIAIVAALASGPPQPNTMMRWLMLEAPVAQAMLVLMAGVMVEEVGFRLLPLMLALILYAYVPRTGWLVVAIIAVASVAFGFIHGLEWYRLMLQAIGGLVLSIVYLKTCGMSWRYWKRALATTYAVHLGINSAILAAMRLAQSAG